MLGSSFVSAGGHYGIGSGSNVLTDAAGELRQFEYTQRLAGRGRNVMATNGSTGRALFDAALCGGGQRLDAGTGGVRLGGSANLASLDT